MANPNFIILYVDSPTDSINFYSKLLDKTSIEASPNFAMFALDNGFMLGLWSKHMVQPAATAYGGTELAFTVASNAIVDDKYHDWQKRGLTIIQPPTNMGFGYSFVAQDPDGHRLRVFAIAAR